MEVEVKLRLLDAANHSRLKEILSPFHIKKLNQKNVFFDSANGILASQRAVLRLRSYSNNNNEITRCVLSLKAKSVLNNGVSRVEEDEEEIEPLTGEQCVEEASKLGLTESRIIKRCKDEFGIDEEMGFVCLGGFENVRDVYEWRGLKLEVDESKFSFGVSYEVECENDDPEKVKRELEGFLKENGIDYKYSEMSKFAIFRAGKLP
ncbi:TRIPHOSPHATE TUNNEL METALLOENZYME 3 [Salix viminalis]|uniref:TRIPHOSPHATE TUNNEL METALLOENZYME 3 n=1 Tax=Salix viminalis TaxID=40686 RepID=A0A6N2N0U3_SALVM|nr:TRIPHOSPHATE TUNNEL METALLOENZYME 3 [Salix viminalis]